MNVATTTGTDPAYKMDRLVRIRKNLVFVHIPKAGGTSVRNYISKYVSGDRIYPQAALHHFPRYRDLDTESPMLFMSHLGYDFVKEAEADAFILMRHPIERVLSVYSYSMYPGENAPLIPANIVRDMTLQEFLQSDRDAIRMNIDNAQTWQIASGYSAKHRMLRLRNGANIEQIKKQAIKNLEASAVIGVLENLPAFYARIDAYFDARYLAQDMPEASNVSSKRLRWNDLNFEEKSALEKVVKDEWDVYEAALNRCDRD